MRIYTIGHGSRSFDDFVALLRPAHIQTLIDVRAFPVSRRHPHFARAQLQAALAQHGIEYGWEGKAFGGFRKPAPDSPNVAIKQAAFRGFADHMGTSDFRVASQALWQRATQRTLALMCAERSPSQCHRALIADFLTARGAQVIHLLDEVQEIHRMHAAAREVGDALVYAMFPANDALPF